MEETYTDTGIPTPTCTDAHIDWITRLNDMAWQSMLKEAEEFDRSVNETFEATAEYLEWFNALPESVRDAMKLMPRDVYYTDPETQKEVYRIYAVIEDLDSGTCDYHVARAMIMTFRKLVLSADKLQRIDRWTEEQLFIIRLSRSPEIFIDPNGWTILASMMNDEAVEKADEPT